MFSENREEGEVFDRDTFFFPSVLAVLYLVHTPAVQQPQSIVLDEEGQKDISSCFAMFA